MNTITHKNTITAEVPPREYAFGLDDVRAALAYAEEHGKDRVDLETPEDIVEIAFDEVEIPDNVRNVLIPVVGYNVSRSMNLHDLFDWISE